MTPSRHPRICPATLPATAAERVYVNVMRLGDGFQKQDDAFFRPYGLTSAQYNVLRIVEGAGEPLPQREIAARLLVSRRM